jgi:hypothetical protein
MAGNTGQTDNDEVKILFRRILFPWLMSIVIGVLFAEWVVSQQPVESNEIVPVVLGALVGITFFISTLLL